MSESEAGILIGEIEKGTDSLVALYEFFERALSTDVPKLGRGQSAAILVAGTIDSYYACLETIFFRISQFFENSLSKDRWHADLLKRMLVTVEGRRPAVIRDATFTELDEIRRFRHFNRYYFNVQYDWDRIDLMIGKVKKAQPLVTQDLAKFTEFARRLLQT